MKTNKTAKSPPEHTANIKDKIIKAIEDHWRTKGTEPKKIVLSPITAWDLLKLTPADIGDDLFKKAWTEGIAAFKGKILGLPFELNSKCPDIEIQ